MAEEVKKRGEFFDNLEKMMSTAVMIRSTTDKKLRVVDIDKVQVQSNLETNRLIDRFARVIMPIRTYGYDYSYAFQGSRIEIYRDYEQMDMYPILSSALDIYSDETTLKNLYGKRVEIKTDKDYIAESLNNLFYDILNIDFNLWAWVRNLVKYGDFWLKLDITEKLGITNAIPLSPYGVQRVENPNNPEDIEFHYDAALGNYMYGQSLQRYKNFEIIHFRLLSDMNYLPYGRSIFEAARQLWKQIVLLQDAMLIHKLMRAPERRVIKVDIGNIPPHEIDNYMNGIIAKMKKTPYIDENTGQYNLRFNLMNMLEDFYLPVRTGQTGTSIDTLQGLTMDFTEELNFLLGQMFAAIKIPKAFLGYEETLSAKNVLLTQDVRFARTIERVQRIVESELYKMAIIHLYSQGYTGDDLVDYKIVLTPSSILYEEERNTLLTNKIDLVSRIREQNVLPYRYIYEELFGFSEQEWKKMREELIEDTKWEYRLEQIKTEGIDPYEEANRIKNLLKKSEEGGEFDLTKGEEPGGGVGEDLFGGGGPLGGGPTGGEEELGVEGGAGEGPEAAGGDFAGLGGGEAGGGEAITAGYNPDKGLMISPNTIIRNKLMDYIHKRGNVKTSRYVLNEILNLFEEEQNDIFNTGYFSEKNLD